MQEVSFSVNNQKLIGTILYPEKLQDKNPAILLIHGWMSSQKRNILTAQTLVKQGFICMTFDLRSHGGSEGARGKLSRDDYLQDCIAAYDLLAQQKHVDHENIGVIGSSFGSYLACILSVTRKLSWLILRVPANYPDEGFDKPQVKFTGVTAKPWREKKLSVSENTALQAVHGFSNPILVIESENDELVPQQTITNYLNAAPDRSLITHEIMIGSGHSMVGEKAYQDYLRIVTKWLQEKV